MTKKIDHRYKIIVLGESNVGKTALLYKYKTDVFQESLISTIGMDTISNTLTINKKNVVLNIWDTAGQERFFSITKSYYRNADAIFLVFDLSVHNTFITVDRWYENIKKENGDVPLFLIGNKKDLLNDSEYKLIEKSIKEKAKGIRAKYYCTSAKCGLNVNKIFEDMAKILIKKGSKIKQEDPAVLLPRRNNRFCW